MVDYVSYMRDYLEENSPEEFALLPPSDEFDEAGKEGVYKENYYYRDKLQLPFVTPKLAIRKNRDLIIDKIGEFIDKNSSKLSTPGPVYTFTFGDAQISFLYEIFGVTSEQLLKMYDEMVKVTYDGKISNVYTGLVSKAPQKVLFVAILADAQQHGYTDIVECVEYMFALTEYPILYHKYWQLGVREDVMNYTIEHLGSKYKIRQLKTLQSLLMYDANAAVEFYVKSMTPNCPDNVYMDIIYSMRSRFNSKIGKIANQYYHNIETNATQHTDVAEYDDGQLAEQEGHSGNIAGIINKVNSKFIANGVNKSNVKIAAEGSKTDPALLEGMINQIYSTSHNKISKFIEDVVTAYFAKNPTSWDLSSDFMVFALSLYRSIGTSKDPIYIEIKQIMAFWMYDIINIGAQYSSQGTIINYTRAVFNYMILTINSYA